MSTQTYDTQWELALRAIRTLLDLVSPKDYRTGPKDFAGWSQVYCRWVQATQDMEAAFDKIYCAPLRLSEMKQLLEACTGHALEIRQVLVSASSNHILNLDAALSELGMVPETAELPFPRYVAELRAREMAEVDGLLTTFLSQHQDKLREDKARQEAAQQSAGKASEPIRAPKGLEATNTEQQQQSTPADATNTPGPHSADKAKALSEEQAAIRIQAGLRGLLARGALARQQEEEGRFLGMLVQEGPSDALEMDASASKERKRKQAAKQKLYDLQCVKLLRDINSEQGAAMHEAVQDKISRWFLQRRAVEKDNFPELPAEDAGGSKGIQLLDSPPPQMTLKATKRKTAAMPARAASTGPVEGAVPGTATKSAMTGTRGKSTKGKGAARLEVPKLCLPDVQAATAALAAKWQPVGADIGEAKQREERMLRGQLQPFVAEQIRLTVDAQLRELLHNLRERMLAEKAALAKAAAKGEGGKGKKGTAKKKTPRGSAKPGKHTPPKSPKSPKSGEGSPRPIKAAPDLTVGRSRESLMEELVSSGILQCAPEAHLQDYIASPDLFAPPQPTKLSTTGGLGTTAKGPATQKPSATAATAAASAEKPHHSMHQLKQTLVAQALLPLGSSYLHSKMPHIKSLLLYGCPGTGKTLLAQSVACGAGAAWFDLSPWNTDTKFAGGKYATLLVHMVFKVAKMLAPSVIFMDEVEKVFVSDKRRQRAYGASEPFGRIKKDLIREVVALTPIEQVLVIGNSQEPQACVKGDQTILSTFFDLCVYLPLPDYASRRVIWQSVLESHKVTLAHDYELSMLTELSGGHSPANFIKALRKATSVSSEGDKPQRVVAAQAFIHELGELSKPQPEVLALLKAWPPEIKASKDGKGAKDQKKAKK